MLNQWGTHFFPWEGVEEGECFYLVRLEVVARPVECGELGIDNVRFCNEALLAIWLCFPLELNILWHKIMAIKYGHHLFKWVSLRGLRGKCTNP